MAQKNKLKDRLKNGKDIIASYGIRRIAETACLFKKKILERTIKILDFDLHNRSLQQLLSQILNKEREYTFFIAPNNYNLFKITNNFNKE